MYNAQICYLRPIYADKENIILCALFITYRIVEKIFDSELTGSELQDLTQSKYHSLCNKTI